MDLQTVQLPPLTCRAIVVPESYDSETHMVTLEVAAGAAMRQYNWRYGGEFIEVLEISENAIRSARLDNGAPCLWRHRDWEMDDVLGPVDSWWVKDGSLFTRIRFTDAHENGQMAEKMVANGDLTGVSLGYRVHRYQEQLVPEGEMRRLLAIDWEPYEVTLAPMGEDVLTGVRSANGDRTNACSIQSADGAQETNMDPAEIPIDPPSGAVAEPTGGQRTPTPEPAAPAVDPPAVPPAAPTAGDEPVSTRCPDNTVLSLCAEHELPARFAQGLITRSLDVEGVRSAITDELARSSEEEDVTGRVRVTRDERQTRRLCIENALSHRINPSGVELTDGGRQFRGMRMMEVARNVLEFQGVDTLGMAPMELAQRALHSSSDLPNVIGSVTRRSLLRSYDGGRRSFTAFSQQTSFVDFRSIDRVSLGGAPELEKINEHGEVKYGTMSDGKYAIGLDSYGKAIGFTRKSIINDDLSALDRIPRAFGNSAYRLENRIVYALITGNAKTGDGKALFHNDHNNTGAGVIGITGLSTGRSKMRLQKQSTGGKEPMNLVAGHLLVPTTLETVATQMISSQVVPGTTGDVNVFAGSLEIIVEPLLDANDAAKWYLVAEDYETVEYGYLEGSNGVNIEVYTGADIDGVKLKATHDFAAALAGYEGFYRSTGV